MNPLQNSEPTNNLNCLMEIIKLLKAWCKSCLIPFRRSVRDPDSVNRGTPPDPQNPFEELAPFSASTSTDPWQIFINHRGIDVKYTFASKIHRTLEGMGYRSFLDVEALEPGDVIPAEIQEAMSSASLHIAIFSPYYAQSPWCLDELSFILETGANIIPIFYHVEPSDLRWVGQGKGKYAHAFSEHVKKGRYTEEKLNQWKEALCKISFHSGFQVNDNEDEATVLKNIVNSALKVQKSVPLWVAEHPLGLDELVEGFQSVASEDRVKITGIVGMGGSGKTTLAKELFNRNFSSFDRCSFVSDVRDAASRNVLTDKQKKLLKDLDVKHSSFDSVDEGKAVLAIRLSSVRALIVLDDVDHIDQLYALLPKRDNLGSQSMVIVTSRDFGVLQSWGLSCIYKMPGLNKSHSRQLFCWHAFLQPSAPAEFETLVEEFLRACNGLPLSLKVLGAQLYGIDSKDYWKSQLDKISRILPGDIKKRLQVSYDSLDEEEREMFLDVACFLIGEYKSTAIILWDGMNLSGLHGLRALVNKCLVELVYEEDLFRSNIFKEDKIRMHDHLRDMGREIAGRHSSCRLWSAGQIHNLKKHLKEEMPIRGIRSPATFVAFKECTHQLTRITNGLQILQVEKNDFTEEFESLSKDVVWLRWYNFSLKVLPPWLTLRHLTVLELNGVSKLEELWEGNVDPPLQLRKLSISGAYGMRRFPTSIGRLQYLKMLSISYYGSSLPEEFCGLMSLEYLRLDCTNCIFLCSLPAGFGNLINLKQIDLEACRQLRTLPYSFEQLIHLEDLALTNSLLSSLPDGFGNLTSLKQINLGSCDILIRLPDSFSQLRRLESLNLSSCYNLSSLPAGLGNCVNLKLINLQFCWKLSTLPDSFKHLIHLEHLDLGYCDKLNLNSDAFEHIRKLRFLGLVDCEELKDLPHQIVNQVSLTKLNLRGCIKLRGSPSNMGQLVNLQSLTIESLMLKSLQASLVSFSSLKDIEILSSHSKMDFDGEEEEYKSVSISNDCCPNLEVFEVNWYINRALSAVHTNRHLIEVETLPVSLKRLSLRCCGVLKTITCLSGLVCLEKLEIKECPQLEALSSFVDLASLKEFVMSECPKVVKIEGLQHCKSLKHLWLPKTRWKVPGIQNLEKAEGLETLVLECDTISALKPCVQSIKKCPRKMRIQGSVSHVVEPVVDSVNFPDLALHEVTSRWPSAVDEILDSLDSADYFCSEEGKEENGKERKVVQIYLRHANDGGGVVRSDSYGISIEKAVIVSGRRGRVVEALDKLLALLE